MTKSELKEIVQKATEEVWYNRRSLNPVEEQTELITEKLYEALILPVVGRSLPTNTDYLSEVRVKLFDEHVERLSKQTKEWNLMEGIRLGLNAEKP